MKRTRRCREIPFTPPASHSSKSLQRPEPPSSEEPENNQRQMEPSQTYKMGWVSTPLLRHRQGILMPKHCWKLLSFYKLPSHTFSPNLHHLKKIGRHTVLPNLFSQSSILSLHQYTDAQTTCVPTSAFELRLKFLKTLKHSSTRLGSVISGISIVFQYLSEAFKLSDNQMPKELTWVALQSRQQQKTDIKLNLKKTSVNNNVNADSLTDTTAFNVLCE